MEVVVKICLVSLGGHLGMGVLVVLVGSRGAESV